MKPQYSFPAVVLAVFIVINAIFVARYAAKTDFSWPEIKFENYSNHAAARPEIRAFLTIKPGDSNYSYTLTMPEESTAADLLQEADEKYDIGLQIKSFGASGLFVDGLMGKTGDSKTNTYWIYYINNESAAVGVSQYKLKDGDRIMFKYEKADF